MKIKISKDMLEHVLRGLDEMLAWYDVKLKQLEPPTKEDDTAELTRKLLELALLTRYAEILTNTHNLIIALAYNCGMIDLEQEDDDDT